MGRTVTRMSDDRLPQQLLYVELIPLYMKTLTATFTMYAHFTAIRVCVLQTENVSF